MRTPLAMAAACAALLTTGCGRSDAEVRAELRNQMMQRCDTDMAPRAASLPGVDVDDFCTCVTDRSLGESDVAELKALFDDKAKTAERGREAGTFCLAQQLPGGGGQESATAEALPGATAAQSSASAEPDEESAEEAADESM